MEKYKISKGKPRPLKMFGFGISEYRENMTKWWNDLLDNQKLKDTQELKLFAESLLHLEDMIIQAENAHRAEVEALKEDLAKWKENRGRKPVLTFEQREEIRQRNADSESCRKLANEYGVSERTIRRVLKTCP